MKAVSANDWLQVDDKELCKRSGSARVGADRISSSKLIEGDRVLGRAILAPGSYGQLCANGIAVEAVPGLAGLLLGEVLVAARDEGIPLATESTLAAWASAQLSKVNALGLPDALQAEYAAVGVELGGEVPPALKVCRAKSGWLTLEEARCWVEDRDEIWLTVDNLDAGVLLGGDVHDVAVELSKVDLEDDVIVIPWVEMPLSSRDRQMGLELRTMVDVIDSRLVTAIVGDLRDYKWDELFEDVGTADGQLVRPVDGALVLRRQAAGA